MIEKCKTCINGYPSISCVNCGTGLRNYRPYTPPTNADRIRGMSDEELAEFIDDIQNDAFAADGCGYSLHFPDDKETTWIDWLRQPAEE